MSKEKMTWGDRVEKLKNDIWKIYDQAGGMRDFATGEEKEAFNKLRGALDQCAGLVSNLEGKMTHNRRTTNYE